MAHSRKKWKKGTYYYVVMDNGKRKRFKKGEYPTYKRDYNLPTSKELGLD
jgi:hypothetical protein